MKRLSLAVVFLFVSFASFGCSSGFEPGTTNTAEGAIASVCYTNIGGVTGVYPWNATWPIGSQHVACEHQPTAFVSGSWPPNVAACTGNPNGGMIPGVGQVDVWTKVNTSPASYLCARVSIPAGGHYSLDYQTLMQLGWRATYPDGAHNRWIQGITAGPDTAGQFADLANVYASGPISAGLTYINWPENSANWLQIDTSVTTSSLELHRAPPH